MPFSALDQRYMAEALRLAARGRSRTHPNPMVGCILVRDGQVVGQGYHRRAGEDHAEVHALRQAGELSRGATAYVTLEPCAHHGRTPPCADALIAAGVARVVAAMVDPDPRTAGQGLERLRAAGIAAEAGLLEAEAEALNRAWLTWKRTGRPLVILKWAMTLDGKIACATGDSRWVTGEAARIHAHQLRDQVDAILVGQGTARCDNPALTTRAPVPGPLPGWAGGLDPGLDPGPDEAWRPKDPLRVVLDSAAQLAPGARLFDPALRQRPWPNQSLVAATGRAAPERVARLQEAGAEVLILPEQEGLVDLAALLDELGQRGIASLLVEGGGRVHSSFLAQGLADRLLVYIAPKLVGGEGAPSPVGGPGLAQMAAAWRLTQRPQITPLGDDLLLEGELKKG